MIELLNAIHYDDWVLHISIWLPVVGMVAVLAGPDRWAKHTALAVATLVFLVSLGLWVMYQPGSGVWQLGRTRSWIPQWGINYSVAIDGIALMMVLLTTFLMPLAILGSYKYIAKKEKAFYSMMLLLETGILGVFCAVDLFLFFMFWEIMLVPMYFIIGIWGGDRRIYAAIKFFLFTAAGSLLMLVGILYLFFKHQQLTGVPSFAYGDLVRLPLTFREQFWLFSAFALAFAIKIPVFPFHTWLPDAHVEAPTPGSVVLAAVMLKLGAFGFLRYLLPFFPQAATHESIVGLAMVLGLFGIIYAAWVAAVQPDAKKLIAYTSVAHMGFVVLGIFAFTIQGIQGALLIMLSHGFSTGAMFLMLGMLYERRHTRRIEDFGGLASVAPMFAAVFVFTALASIGLPGTSGFTGEFLALIGTFQTHPWAATVAATGVIFAAYYMLPMVQRIWFNRLDKPENERLPDLSRREAIVLGPLVAFMLLLGVYPKPVLDRMEVTVVQLLESVEQGRSASVDYELKPMPNAGSPVPAPATSLTVAKARVP